MAKKMNKQEALDKIKELEQYIESVESKEDFSKFVGRRSEDLCIFGEEQLKSIDLGSIVSIEYNNLNRGYFDQDIKYEVVNLSDLNYGDVFIEDHISSNEAEICDFNLFVGVDKAEYYHSYYLGNYSGLEKIDSWVSIQDYKVKRFLRE